MANKALNCFVTHIFELGFVDLMVAPIKFCNLHGRC